MATNIRGIIMVAVREPDSSARALLRKAARLAKSQGCRLILVHAIALPYPASTRLRKAVLQAARETLESRERALAKIARDLESRGIPSEPIVVWDYPAADAIVRQVMKHRPRLLLAESQRHARLARPFLGNTDWELIRKCPCPLWFSKSGGAVGTGPVIAALDPQHANDKTAALDRLILAHSIDAAGGRPERVLAVHAQAPAAADMDTAGKLLDRLVRRRGIPERNRLLLKGEAARVLPQAARSHRASVVVMGAVSRSALARLFIGHTAERVIDSLGCDVLIVKPRGFRSNVVPRRLADIRIGQH